MPPSSHQVSYNYDWSYGSDDNTQHEDPPAPTTIAPKKTKTIVKQVQIAPIPPSGSGQLHKQIGNVKIDAQWSYNHGSSAASTTAATTTTPDDTTTIATTTTDRDLDENEDEE